MRVKGTTEVSNIIRVYHSNETEAKLTIDPIAEALPVITMFKTIKILETTTVAELLTIVFTKLKLSPSPQHNLYSLNVDYNIG